MIESKEGEKAKTEKRRRNKKYIYLPEFQVGSRAVRQPPESPFAKGDLRKSP